MRIERCQEILVPYTREKRLYGKDAPHWDNRGNQAAVAKVPKISREKSYAK